MGTKTLLDAGEAGDSPQGRMRMWWTKACLWEGISPRCSFVVFSPENPYQKEYDRAYREYQNSLSSPKVEEE